MFCYCNDMDRPKTDKAIKIRPKEDSTTTSASDNCIVCGEYGKGGEIIMVVQVYSICGQLAHKACSDADHRPQSLMFAIFASRHITKYFCIGV